jgi:hypothetical protein
MISLQRTIAERGPLCHEPVDAQPELCAAAQLSIKIEDAMEFHGKLDHDQLVLQWANQKLNRLLDRD